MTAKENAPSNDSTPPDYQALGMAAVVGLWECPTCGDLTDVSHYFTDRASGVLSHEANAERRAKYADRCGWRYDYDDGIGVVQCALRHGHGPEHDPKLHGVGRFREDEWCPAPIPPYEARQEANRAR